MDRRTRRVVLTQSVEIGHAIDVQQAKGIRFISATLSDGATPGRAFRNRQDQRDVLFAAGNPYKTGPYSVIAALFEA